MRPPELPADLAQAITHAIRDALGAEVRLQSAQLLGGAGAARSTSSAISANWRLATTQGALFLKTAPDAQDRFAAEADGLSALARSGAARIPAVMARGGAGGSDYLVLEWLDLAATGDEARLGAAIAHLHAGTDEAFGWPRDNHLGRSPQDNARGTDWGDFFLSRRLGPKLAATSRQGWPELETAFAPFAAALRARLSKAAPRPALLHGDLWRGNVGFVDGEPALFDPACHYGDKECDLAMAALFGGFAPDFFTAYRQASGDAANGPDLELRIASYQLYQILNHVNLFGHGYVGQARRLIGSLARHLA